MSREDRDRVEKCQDDVRQVFEAKIGVRVGNKAEDSELCPVTNEGTINIFEFTSNNKI